MNNNDEEEPKPLVSYAFIPKDEKDQKPDILDELVKEYNSKNKIPLQFGQNKNVLNSEIKDKINEHHQFKEPISNKNNIDLEEDDDIIGPSLPKDFKMEEEDNKELNISDIIPVSHIVEFPHTKDKSLTCLDIDPSANLLATGSYDGTVKIWDFNSMTRRPEANHTINCTDEEEFPVLALSWSSSGGFLLVCCGDCQAKVLSRDGNTEISCLKGD
ncbi:MAG: hypothetical protein MJ252_15935, partial [archaeon]|nr:hypothetical protein [archaeon]